MGNTDEKGAVPDGFTGPVGGTEVGNDDGPVTGAVDEARVELGKALKLGAPDELPILGADGNDPVSVLSGGREKPELTGSVLVVPFSPGTKVEASVGSEDRVAVELSVELTDTGADGLPLSRMELEMVAEGDVVGGP